VTRRRKLGATHPASFCLLLAALGATAVEGGGIEPGAVAEARRILATAGVSGGLVVHLGCGDGQLTAALRASQSFLVHGLDRDPANARKARDLARSLGLRGAVSADTFDGENLPYTDNLVNLLVASQEYDVPRAEMLRVLAPRGVAVVRAGGGWKKLVKPWPNDIDEWTHYLHGPDNNAVAHDKVIGPPRHMQWLGAPAWTRNHHRLNSISSVVTAAGRLFYIADEATAANMSVPGKWALVARDAFSGVLLWKKPLASWTWHSLRFRSGPPQVTRLLVASERRVYAPLGLSAPVSAMDAATGKTLRTFDNTAGAEEMILAGRTLLVLRGSPVAEHAVGHPAFKAKFKPPSKKAIVALDAETGEALWQWSDPQGTLMPETLGSDGKRAFVQVGNSVACLDLKSGKELWRSPRPQQGNASAKGKAAKKTARKPRRRAGYGKYTLVVADGVVLCNLAGRLTALAAENGKKLWDCPAGGGFHSPLDVFVINGLVWQGKHPSDSVAPAPVHDFSEGRYLRTGEVKETNDIMVRLQTAGHHHRCYREKATDRFIITGKRGIEMMDLADDEHSRNNWVRGSCQYGIMPANGLIYAPPHSCGCYMESKLWGFWALAPSRPVVAARAAPADRRLQAGPAYGKSAGPAQPAAEAWPQYRHDPLRSGVATTVLPTRLKRAWSAKLGGRLTQPVAAGGKVLVAAVDEGTVYALDARDGKVAWHFVAGGRVDSPPAIHGGTAIFGSADGRVYCLRLADGALAWSFLAAPADLRAVAYDRVESLWPVHGSVLVLNGVAYCAAGRSTWLDGGIRLYGLDPATGKVVCETQLKSQHPRLGKPRDKEKGKYVVRVAQNLTDYKTFLEPDLSDSFSMAGGTLSDVLVSDGANVFIHQVKLNARLKKQAKYGRHLFSTSSLLDGAENHRSHWVLGTGDFSRIPVAYSWIVNRPGRWNPGIAVPTGVAMVFTGKSVWAVRRKGDANGKYYLLQRPNKPFSPDDKPLPDFRRLSKDQQPKNLWQRDLPVRTRAMLKSGDHLFLGAAPIAIPEKDPHAAYEGRLGGMLLVVSAKDGSTVAEQKLESPVVWDGMAAASGKLLLSTQAGEVQCWEGE